MGAPGEQGPLLGAPIIQGFLERWRAGRPPGPAGVSTRRFPPWKHQGCPLSFPPSAAEPGLHASTSAPGRTPIRCSRRAGAWPTPSTTGGTPGRRPSSTGPAPRRADATSPSLRRDPPGCPWPAGGHRPPRPPRSAGRLHGSRRLARLTGLARRADPTPGPTSTDRGVAPGRAKRHGTLPNRAGSSWAPPALPKPTLIVRSCYVCDQ